MSRRPKHHHSIGDPCFSAKQSRTPNTLIAHTHIHRPHQYHPTIGKRQNQANKTTQQPNHQRWFASHSFLLCDLFDIGDAKWKCIDRRLLLPVRLSLSHQTVFHSSVARFILSPSYKVKENKKKKKHSTIWRRGEDVQLSGAGERIRRNIVKCGGITSSLVFIIYCPRLFLFNTFSL